MNTDAIVYVVRELDLPEARLCLRSDGLYHLHFKKDVVCDIPLQTRLREVFREFVGDAPCKFIFSAEEGLVLTKEARENAHVIHKDSRVLYYALVVNSLAYKIVANFYLNVIKPKGHFKMVNTIKEAARWLHSMPDQ
jgi:hypothetical protein